MHNTKFTIEFLRALIESKEYVLLCLCVVVLFVASFDLILDYQVGRRRGPFPRCRWLRFGRYHDPPARTQAIQPMQRRRRSAGGHTRACAHAQQLARRFSEIQGQGEGQGLG